jgi:UDP-2-acetamido-2,6-beta-L-arabino-hexul-4-ose reductase
MSVRIEKLRVAADPRGDVFEPLDAAGLAGQRNVHVVWTAPGHVRGNHFHRQGHEISAVRGPALARYRAGEELTEVEIPAGEVWRFTFPPAVVHAFKNTGTGPMIIVSFNTTLHDPDQPDVVRESLFD